MSTHINAKMGDYADTVLLPGDPLRAKYIAENFLENVKQVNSVRNAFGYTGEYKGHRISVQGSGMGIPSMSIYINELVREFGVKTIIYNDELDMEKLRDYGILGTEMESAGLYLLAAKLHFRALSVLTVSDLIFGDEKATAEERERTFNDMINISLETAIAGK